MSRVEKPIPESLMKAIRVVMATDAMTPPQKVEAVTLIAHGAGLWAIAETIDPRSYAIPERQWTEISQMFVEEGRKHSALDGVNLSLSWMDVGPSAYKDAS